MHTPCSGMVSSSNVSSCGCSKMTSAHSLLLEVEETSIKWAGGEGAEELPSLLFRVGRKRHLLFYNSRCKLSLAAGIGFTLGCPGCFILVRKLLPDFPGVAPSQLTWPLEEEMEYWSP